jgi:hypothetical protein
MIFRNCLNLFNVITIEKRFRRVLRRDLLNKLNESCEKIEKSIEKRFIEESKLKL